MVGIFFSKNPHHGRFSFFENTLFFGSPCRRSWVIYRWRPAKNQPSPANIFSCQQVLQFFPAKLLCQAAHIRLDLRDSCIKASALAVPLLSLVYQRHKWPKLKLILTFSNVVCLLLPQQLALAAEVLKSIATAFGRWNTTKPCLARPVCS